jgi:ribosomal protein L37E
MRSAHPVTSTLQCRAWKEHRVDTPAVKCASCGFPAMLRQATSPQPHA